MKLVGLSMDGFRVFSGSVELDLSDVGACTVVGANGRGKSTLFDAVLWSLYGDTAEHSTGSLVSLGGDSARASSTWVDGEGGIHTFTRHSSGKRSTVEYLSPEGGKVSGAQAVTDIATELMGCDRDRFKMSCLARQDDLGRFASLPGSKRRSEMVELLVGNLFDDATTSSKNALSEAAESVTVTIMEREAAERELSAAIQVVSGLETVRSQLDQAIRDAEQFEAEAERMRSAQSPVDRTVLENAERAQEQLEQSRVRYQELICLIPQLKTEEAEASALLAQVSTECDDVELGHDRAKQEAMKAQAAAGDAKERLRAIMSEDGVCWVCDRPLSEELRTRLGRRQKRLLLAQREAEKDLAEAEGSLRRARDDKRSASERVTTMEKRVSNSESEKDHVFNSIQVLQPQTEGLDDLREQARTGQATPEQLRQAQNAVRAAERRVGELQAHLEQIEKEEAFLGDRERRVSERKEAEKDAETNQEALKLLVSAFSPNGLPHMLLAERMGDMNAHINRVLSGLRTDDGESLRIAFRFQKSSGAAELGIDVHTPAGTLDYAMMSGGMRARIDLAIRVGLAHYTGVKCRTMIVDEGTAMLDQQGIDSLLFTMEQLITEGHLESVYLVTHDDRLSAVFPSSITVFGDAQGKSHAKLERRSVSIV